MDLVEYSGGLIDDTQRHPWEAARARILLRLIADLGADRSTRRWLDVGAGDAWLAGQLREQLPSSAEIVCWDIGYDENELLADDRPAGIRRTAKRPDGRFGGVLMLDVVEHVEDDVGFVREVVEESLEEGGWVLVTVPAYQMLFCEHDRVLKHYRRYAPRAIRRVLRSAGLQVEAGGSFFHSLLPVRSAQVVKERVVGVGSETQGIGGWQGGENLTRWLTLALEIEGRVSIGMGMRRLPTPPGLSTWALCRRAVGIA